MESGSAAFSIQRARRRRRRSVKKCRLFEGSEKTAAVGSLAPFNTCLEDNKAEAQCSMHLRYCPGLRMLVIKVHHHINGSICQRACTRSQAHTHSFANAFENALCGVTDVCRPSIQVKFTSGAKKQQHVFRLLDDP